jgi:hypothetical protein
VPQRQCRCRSAGARRGFGKLNADAGELACTCADLGATAEAFELLAHDLHAIAAALGQLGGGQAALEDQTHGASRILLQPGITLEHSALACDPHQLFGVDAAAIIANLQLPGIVAGTGKLDLVRRDLFIVVLV